ncbi:MAG: redoxin family protein [Alphaproteobacteria bacterium]
MIKIGDSIPSVTIREVTEDGPNVVSTSDFFAGKKIAMFGVPGAFTSTCSARHLPGFANNVEGFRAKGVDIIACTSVNDAAVMKAWGEQSGTKGSVVMLSDGNADLARALGVELDLSKNGMGVRSRRYSMLIEDGNVTQLNLEEPGAFGVSSGEHLLTQI